MLRVGRPPIEQVVYNEFPKAPITKKGKKGAIMIPSGISRRINRIMLSGRESFVELRHVVSPSEIYVRIINHITDKTLALDKKDVSDEPLGNVKIGDYAMAPFNSMKYYRCRVIDMRENIVKVMYIDDGLMRWMNKELLREIPEDYIHYPWQVICICMFGLYPAPKDLFEKLSEGKWSPNVCEVLVNIMKEYPYLLLDVPCSSVWRNDYECPIPCVVMGVKDYEKRYRQGVDIASVLAASCIKEVEKVFITDAVNQKTFCVDRQSIETVEVENIEIKDSIDEQDAKEVPYLHVAKDMPTLKSCLKNYEIDGKVYFQIRGSSVKSPYHWFARPLERSFFPKTIKSDSEITTKDSTEIIKKSDSAIAKFLVEIEEFYSVSDNRRPYTISEIKADLMSNKPVYAIGTITHDRLPRLDIFKVGLWQRVKVIEITTFARVHLIDTGTEDLVIPNALYRIEPQHLVRPPTFYFMSLNPKVIDCNGCSFNSRKDVIKLRSAMKEEHLITVDVKNIKHNQQLMIQDANFVDESVTLVEAINCCFEDY